MAQVNLTLAHVHSELSVGQMDGIGWDGWMVIIGRRWSKSTFGADKNKNTQTKTNTKTKITLMKDCIKRERERHWTAFEISCNVFVTGFRLDFCKVYVKPD